MKIVQQSRQAFTRGNDTVKFNVTFLVNLIVVVFYVLKISLSRFSNFVFPLLE